MEGEKQGMQGEKEEENGSVKTEEKVLGCRLCLSEMSEFLSSRFILISYHLLKSTIQSQSTTCLPCGSLGHENIHSSVVSGFLQLLNISDS